MPSYMKSMTSQIIFMLVITIIILQLYNFYNTGEILDLFSTVVSGFLGYYFRGITHQAPDNNINIAEVKKVDVNKPLSDNNTDG